MLKSNQTYFNDSKTPSSSGAVVLYRALEEKSTHRASIAAATLILFASVSIAQLNFVYSEETGENPITAPKTYAETPVTSPEVSPTPTPSPEVTITYPNGGETFNVGEVVRVTWEQKNVAQCVVDYVFADGTHSSKFYAIDPDNEYFDWTVEIDNLNQGDSAQVKMNLSCYDSSSNGAHDQSDNFFTVVNPAAPTPAPSQSNNNPGNGNNNNGGSSNGGSNGPSVCNDAKPATAPYITNAVVTGPNQVTLNWTKAQDPVTYYLATYGLKPGSQQYGNPNIGDRNTTSTTIGGLSVGATYYFRIRAGNHCTPGEFSNEVGVRVVKGAKFTSPAQGFIPGVLGSKKINVSPVNNQKTTNSTAAPAKKASQINNAPKNSFFSVVQNFLSSFFK